MYVNVTTDLLSSCVTIVLVLLQSGTHCRNNYRSVSLHSTFKHYLKTELFRIAYSKHEHSA